MIKLAVLLYCVAAIGLGWASMRRGDAGVAFWTAGRELDATSVGLSMSAGFMSISWSCVYAVQVFYAYGLGGLWLITLPWLVALFGIYHLAGRYRELPAFSQPEMVGARFGPGTRKLVACALCFVFLAWGGAEIFVAATLLAPGLDMDVDTTVVAIAVVVGIYATMGGFRAVVATDKLQYGIVALYVIAMSWLALQGMLAHRDGNVLPGTEVAALRSGASWTSLWAPGLVTIGLTFAAYLPGWLFETDLWVRVLAARDATAARRGVLLAGANAVVFVGILPLFVGVTALELFPPVAGAGPAGIGPDGDAIFAALVAEFAPSWMAVLVAAGLVAAAMSTIDTCANVVALAFAYDLLRLHERAPGMLNVRTATALSMVGLCLFALNTGSLWDLFYLSGGMLTTAVALPVAAVIWRGASARGVAWSSAAGGSATGAAYLLERTGYLAAIEPAAVAESGLGFVLWGIAAALAGYAAGSAWRRPVNA
ncbi:MAG: hypothetical protein RLW62_19755 [Gammaproteobacteria bacterium]